MNGLTRAFLFATAALAAAPAFAHPGHGRDGGSHELAHYATEPDHLAPLALGALAAAAVGGWFAWSRRRA